MIQLEDLTAGARVRGILPHKAVTVVQLEWFGNQALTLTYRDDTGQPGHQILYRTDEERIELEETSRPWSFDADGKLFRLASEGLRRGVDG